MDFPDMAASHTRSRHHAARFLALLFVAACGTGEPVEVEDPVPTTLEITVATVDMTFLGQSAPLTARVLDQNGAVVAGSVIQWLTDDPGVATVSDIGVVVAVANGSATITATSGTLSATVAVTVAQVASGLVLVSGNSQEAIAGTTLAIPIVVRVVDGGGQAVPGETVTFTPDLTHGSVSETTVVSDAGGEAATTWTLGTSFGPQRLVASIDATSTDIDAIARSEFATPDFEVISQLFVNRADPTTLETFRVTATVKNVGDLTTGAPNEMRLLADGVEVGSAVIPTLAPDEESVVQVEDIGPLAAGTRALSFVADPDDVLVELNEVNNNADRDVVVVTQTQISTSATVPLSGAEGSDLLFRLTVAGAPTNLTVEITGGTGDADLFVDGTGRPSSRNAYAGCISAGPTNAERCQIGLASGTYHILVNVWDGGGDLSGATMSISTGGALLPYDVEIVFIDNGTPAQDQAFLDAAARWSDIIAGDVPDTDFSTNPLDADQCIDGQPMISGSVDDVRIFVSIIDIDGPLGTLAQAGPCVTRGLSNLPVVGSVQFDQADLERLDGDGDMEAVILHEMGHVLGIGTIWGSNARNLIDNPSLPNNQGADTHFTGVNAIEAFDAAGGAAYTDAKVPVENMAGPGSGDAHWRESVLDLELMTPFLDGLQPNPLSAISIQSVKDLGYSVDVSQADAFTFTPFAAQARAEGGVLRRIIDLRGDIRTGPMYTVTQKGDIVEILR